MVSPPQIEEEFCGCAVTSLLLYRCLKIKTGSVRIKLLHPELGGQKGAHRKLARQEEAVIRVTLAGSELGIAVGRDRRVHSFTTEERVVVENRHRGFIRPVTTLSVFESRTF